MPNKLTFGLVTSVVVVRRRSEHFLDRRVYHGAAELRAHRVHADDHFGPFFRRIQRCLLLYRFSLPPA
jgi:hypothetical protein